MRFSRGLSPSFPSSINSSVVDRSQQLPARPPRAARKRTTCAVAACASLALAGTAAGSVLTFDGTHFFPGGPMTNSYGDRVIATGNTSSSFQYGLDCGPTPNILVDYAEGDGEMRWKDTGYGNLTNFIYVEHDINVSNRVLDVTLTYLPPGGTGTPVGGVYLYGFDLAAELGETLSINEVRVIRTGGPAPLPNGTIFSEQWVQIPGDANAPSRKTYVFDPPLYGQTLSIQLNLSNLQGKSDRIGLDNIKFGETFIPSSGSAALVGASLALLATRRRRGATG